jgi:glycosyltransferase involved in cell wall biosynthesis
MPGHPGREFKVFTSSEIRDFVRTSGPRAADARLLASALARPPGGSSQLPAPAGGLRFSIVMPSFNHAHFIERSLNSVLNQGYDGTQLIVMDGGSTDGTPAVLARYGEDIALWRSEADQGQSDALNKGFRHASGEVFGWLNSDDTYLPGAFAHVAALFESHPQIEVVYGDWLSIDTEDRIRERHLGLACSRGQLITEGFFCNAQAMFWRARLHKRFGEFDLRLHYTMDYDLILRLLSLAGRRAFLRTARPLGCFRVYPGQKTGSSDLKVAQEHWHIATRAGVSWKYSPRGRLLRRVYRVKRGAEYLIRRGPAYALLKLRRGADCPSALA